MKGDCNICVNRKLPSDSATCMECGLLRKNYKPITNADRIRSMSDEELAEFIRDQIIDRNIGIPTETWLDWLKQEAEA